MIDPETYDKAVARIKAGWTPDLFSATPAPSRTKASQLEIKIAR